MVKCLRSLSQGLQKNPYGSDEIDKAFDEGWIGTNGYRKSDGSRQHRAIAFQGETVGKEGIKKQKYSFSTAGRYDEGTTVSPLEGTSSSRPMFRLA